MNMKSSILKILMNFKILRAYVWLFDYYIKSLPSLGAAFTRLLNRQQALVTMSLSKMRKFSLIYCYTYAPKLNLDTNPSTTYIYPFWGHYLKYFSDITLYKERRILLKPVPIFLLIIWRLNKCLYFNARKHKFGKFM